MRCGCTYSSETENVVQVKVKLRRRQFSIFQRSAMAMLQKISATAVPLFVAAMAAAPPSAYAQSVETFYKNKTISLVIGYPPAGAPDVYARLLARHLGKYIPGNPSIIARNMPGAGGLLAANHLFNVAPRDGTTLGLTSPTIPLEETLGAPASKYKAAQFNWIGRLATNPNITFINSTSRVKTIRDAFENEAILGATGR